MDKTSSFPPFPSVQNKSLHTRHPLRPELRRRSHNWHQSENEADRNSKSTIRPSSATRVSVFYDRHTIHPTRVNDFDTWLNGCCHVPTNLCRNHCGMRNVSMPVCRRADLRRPFSVTSPTNQSRGRARCLGQQLSEKMARPTTPIPRARLLRAPERTVSEISRRVSLQLLSQYGPAAR